MPFCLRDNLYWCNCGGRVVFLDLVADRYFCLPQAANDAFLQMVRGDCKQEQVEQLEMLVARGMLIKTSSDGRIGSPPFLESPACDALAEPFSRPALLSIIRALACELHATWLLRILPFHEAMQKHLKRGLQSRPDTLGEDQLVLKIVAASNAAALLTRTHNRCLVRALAVHAACRKNGVSSKLVFGVIANPFAAHCWVQRGREILVGGFEQVRLYTPILVLE